MGILGSYRRRCDDRGMGMAEVLVASVILVMVSTATLSMYSVGMRSAMSSKRSTAAAGMADGYMERVRNMAYIAVGVTGGNPDGDLAPEESATVDGMELVLVPTVTWVDDPLLLGSTDYKKVHVTVTAYDSSGNQAMQTVRETYIRDANTTGGDERKPPTVSWSTAPEDGAIVWGTSTQVSGSAATAMASVKLVRLAFYCDSAALRDTSGGMADWVLSAQSTSKSINWDTTRLNEDGNKFSPDGTRSIKIQVTDSLGQQDYKTRRVIVDNVAPSDPTTYTLTGLSAGGLRSDWGLAYDGTDPAAGYRVEVWKENRTDTNWSIPHSVSVGALNSETWVTAQPFGRFWGRVSAVSPRGLTSGTSALGSSAVVMPPALAGTYVLSSSGNGANRQYTTAVTLAAPTAPQFTTTGVVTYDLFRSNDPANMGTVPWKTSTVPTAYTDSNATAKNAKPANWVYRYRVTFKPSGWPNYASNATQAIWSNKALTGTGTTAGSFTLTYQ